jgi:hypothetical protein
MDEALAETGHLENSRFDLRHRAGHRV